MRWTILCGVVGAAIYALACIWKSQRRPDIGKMITCMAYAATIPASVIFLVVAASGDHQALENLAKEHDLGWYIATAAFVVLYHALQHLYDEIFGAWRRNVAAVSDQSVPVPEPAPTAAPPQMPGGGAAN